MVWDRSGPKLRLGMPAFSGEIVKRDGIFVQSRLGVLRKSRAGSAAVYAYHEYLEILTSNETPSLLTILRVDGKMA